MEISSDQDHKLDFERVRLLYRNARFSVVGVFLSAFFFTLFLWDTLPIEIWTFWISAIVLINLPRLLLVEGFHTQLRQHRMISTGDWERWFHIGVVFSSLSWSIIAFFPYRGDLLLSLVYTALILIAMSSASIITLITSLKMALTFLSAAMLPLIARCLISGEEGLLILAVVCLVYYVIFTQMACRLNHAVIDNIQLKFENEDLALKDTLTGLWNRRQLYIFIEQLQYRAMRNAEPFSVILMDLDHFKEYNDSKGHNAGDNLLVATAGIITAESRDEDLAVRYGGEEFLLVLPRAEVEQASQLAERIRLRMERQTGVTLSAGIAAYILNESLEKMMARADEALYLAKGQGRNRVVLYEERKAEE